MITYRKWDRSKIGSIFAVPCGEFYYFARTYKDAAFGFYDFKSTKIPDLEFFEPRKIIVHLSLYHPSDSALDWIYVGCIPFANEEDAWKPPTYVQDIIDPTQYRIYHKGKMRPAKKSEIKGLRTNEMTPTTELCKELKEFDVEIL